MIFESRSNILIIICAFFLAIEVHAQKAEQELPVRESLREQCRRDVAGFYISAYDRKSHSEAYLKLLTDKSKKLATSIEEAELKAKKTKKTEFGNAETEADLEEIKDRKVSEQNLKNLKSLLEENNGLITTTKQTLDASTQIEQETKKQMSAIFSIEPLKSDPKGAFPFTLHYREKCSRFNIDCPLSKATAFELKKFAILHGDIQSCRKYSALSGI